MNTSKLVEWQRIDSVNGLVEPWLTHPFMDMIKTWDLSDKTILETGGGRSTAWWRSKAKWVDTIESSEEWETQIINDLNTANLNNGRRRRRHRSQVHFRNLKRRDAQDRLTQLYRPSHRQLSQW